MVCRLILVILTLNLTSIWYFQAPLYDSLRVLPQKNWPDYMRDGIAAILQNRVGMLNSLHIVIFEMTGSFRSFSFVVAH